MQHLFIPVGTEVSAKFRGAFCEAVVSLCCYNLKYKIEIAHTNEIVHVASEDVELVKSGDPINYLVPEGCPMTTVFPINSIVRISSTDQVGLVQKLIDASLYTVTFDDNDQSQFKRKGIKLKGQKAFKNEDNLNTLPLIKPENFGSPAHSTPVTASRRSRGLLHGTPDVADPLLALATACSTSESESCADDTLESNTDDSVSSVSKVNSWIVEHLDQVVWVDKSGTFPGLVIDPWETEKKRDADNHCVIRSFRDNRFYSVPFKCIQEFDRDMRSDKPQLQAAIDIATAYVVDNVLPKNWVITFAQIYRDIVEFVQDDSVPERVTVGLFSIELGRLFYAVWVLGGFDAVSQMKSWPSIYKSVSKGCLNWGSTPLPVFVAKMKAEYKKHLMKYESVFESRLASNEDNPLPLVFRPEKCQKQIGDLELKLDLPVTKNTIVASEKPQSFSDRSFSLRKSVKTLEKFLFRKFCMKLDMIFL